MVAIDVLEFGVLVETRSAQFAADARLLVALAGAAGK